jgi:hypothetical protein
MMSVRCLRLTSARLRAAQLLHSVAEFREGHAMSIFGVALGGFLMVSASGARADSVRSVAIGGAGRDACSAWVLDRGATSTLAQAASKGRIEWIFGFLSGVNVFADRSGNLKGGVDDPDGVLGWVDKYCHTHPTDPLWTAAGALVLDLRNHPRE